MDKKQILKEQGQVKFQSLIDEAGGVLSTQQVAVQLNVSMDDVRQMQKDNVLLLVTTDYINGYPIWQFDGPGVIKHFSAVKNSLNTSSFVGVVRFFLTEDVGLGETPINALKGGNKTQIEMVRLLARQFNQQIAR